MFIISYSITHRTNEGSWVISTNVKGVFCFIVIIVVPLNIIEDNAFNVCFNLLLLHEFFDFLRIVHLLYPSFLKSKILQTLSIGFHSFLVHICTDVCFSLVCYMCAIRILILENLEVLCLRFNLICCVTAPI